VVEEGHGAALQGQRISVEEGLAGWVVRHNEPAIVDDVQKDDRFARRITDGTGLLVRSLLCAPLVTHGEVIGALQIVNKAIGGSSTRMTWTCSLRSPPSRLRPSRMPGWCRI